jgi:hypothetical protein
MPDQGEAGMTSIYRAGSRLITVKIMILVGVACAIAACWWGWGLFQTYGSNPGDGGVLAPVGTRLAVGLATAAGGFAIAAGMWFYGTIYVGSIDYDEPAGNLHIRTVQNIFGSHDVLTPLTAIEGSRLKGDRTLFLNGQIVNAPWISLRVAGRRAPLVVDIKGEFPDRALAARLFKLA